MASTSRTDSPRTNEAITSDSNALVLVTFLPNSREANAAVVPRSLGRSKVTGPAVVLTVTVAVPECVPSRVSDEGETVHWESAGAPEHVSEIF